MNITFFDDGFLHYTYWQEQDRRTLKKINALIHDIARNGHEGTGHPEPLTGDKSGWWSRHIDKQNRLVYRLADDGSIEIASCRGHYDD